MQEDLGQATALSPLDWIACTSCRGDSLNPNELYLSTCGHTLCRACIAANTSQRSQNNARSCPACGMTGPVVRLDQASDLSHCFRPLSELVGELSMAAEWQVGNLVEQLGFFRTKCAEQKKMLARVGAELKKVKGIKAQAEQLAAENALLKTQIAQAQAPEQRFSSAAQDYPPAPQDCASAAPTPRGQKRKADFSPNRSTLPLRSATNLSNLPPSLSHAPSHPPRSASSASHSLPNGPQRLSLTPRSQREAREGVRRRVVGEGSASMSGSGSGSGGELRAESARERLARFAYDPSASASRASHRPTSTAPFSHRHNNGTSNNEPTPFQFNPPALYERERAGEEREREREREEMPPPRLPFGHAPGPARGGQGGWAGTGNGRGGGGGGARLGTPFAHRPCTTTSSSLSLARIPPSPATPRFSLTAATHPTVPGTPRPFVPSRLGAGGAEGGRFG